MCLKSQASSLSSIDSGCFEHLNSPLGQSSIQKLSRDADFQVRRPENEAVFRSILRTLARQRRKLSTKPLARVDSVGNIEASTSGGTLVGSFMLESRLRQGRAAGSL